MRIWKSSAAQGILIALVAVLAAGDMFARPGSLVIAVITFFITALVILRFVEGS